MQRLLLIFSIVVSIFYICASENQDKLSPILKKRMELVAASNSIPTYPILIHLKEKFDYSQIEHLTPGPERSRVMVEKMQNHSTHSQKSLIRFLESNSVKYQSYWISNIICVEHATQLLIDQLAARNDVEIIRSNHIFKAKLPQPEVELVKTAPLEDLEWNIEWVNAPKVWKANSKGQGVTVAVADTGIQYDHPALIHNYRGRLSNGSFDFNYNWHDSIHGPVHGIETNDDYDTRVPNDDNGHGTHCSGTIVSPIKGIGVAPDAKLIGCRNMYKGTGRPQFYIECLQFFIAPTDLDGKNPDATKAPHVVSNSYGCPPQELCEPDSLKDAVIAVRKAGIFMSVAAGNSGSRCSSVSDPPGTYEEVFSVGATSYKSNHIAGFSSRGPVRTQSGKLIVKPDISAPGSRITSSYPPNTYRSLSGTSMATPHVAGIVALLWGENSGKKPSPYLHNIDATIEALTQTTVVQKSTECDSKDPSHNNVYGFGAVDAYEAFLYMQNHTLSS